MKSKWFDRKNSFFILLAITALGMLIYEVVCCDEFIAYMDGYYTYKYLPDFFIEKNFDYYVKFPMGTAMCEFPFFLFGHVIMLITDPVNANGFGGAYEWAVGLCGIFYFCLGFIFLYTTLKKLFNNRSAFFTCALLMFATPIIYYGSKYASFSHIYTFAFTSIFLYLMESIDDSENEQLISFLMGICVGMIFLIRNVNVLFVMVYALMYLGVKDGFGDHFKKMLSPRRFMYNAIGAVITILPQLIHWHSLLGSWLPNTYSDESFTYLAAPKLYEVWFSDAKGYFIFAPVMILSVIGFFFMAKGGARKYLAGSVAVFAYESYMTAAWWCWWMGGVYSIRSFLDITVFMALPMCAFCDRLFDVEGEKKNLLLEVLSIALCVFFIYVNFALLRGAERGTINETLAGWWQLKQSLLLR